MFDQMIDQLRGITPWSFRSVEFDGDILNIGGWAIVDAGQIENDPFSIVLNDDTKLDVEIKIPKEKIDVFQILQGPESRWFRFQIHIPIRQARAFRNGFAAFRRDQLRANRHAWYHDAMFLPDPELSLPLPPDAGRLRVIGTDEAAMFALGGATDFNKIHLLLEHRFGRPIHTFRNILDWGCGCGRVTRFLARLDGPSCVGADIDPENIDWNSRNIPRAKFVVLPLRPPTPLDAVSFDLVIGISVFTHLREDDQFKWLAELHRITRPGALVLVSIHGAAIYLKLSVPPERVQQIMDNGFEVTGPNDQLNAVIDDHDYYVNVGHSPEYIRREWGKYFDIIDVIPAMITHQDLVVMQKRA